MNYTPLGNGTAAGSNWTLTGLSLPTGQNIYIRARGYYRSGFANGSGSIVESVRNASSPGACQLRVLVVYADIGNPPTTLRSEILAEPDVTAVDLFDGNAGTPTLAQLQQYDIVAPFSDNSFANGVTLGNNLADYVDTEGIVVQLGFSHSLTAGAGVNGRWVTGNYNPYTYSDTSIGGSFTLGAFDAGHPLMAGVTTLNSNSSEPRDTRSGSDPGSSGEQWQLAGRVPSGQRRTHHCRHHSLCWGIGDAKW